MSLLHDGCKRAIVVSVLLLGLVAALQLRSGHCRDTLFVYGPLGYLHAIDSKDQQILLTFTDLKIDRGRSSSVQWFSEEVKLELPSYRSVSWASQRWSTNWPKPADPSEVRQRFGSQQFWVVAGKQAPGNVVQLSFPHWALGAALVIVVASSLYRLVKKSIAKKKAIRVTRIAF